MRFVSRHRRIKIRRRRRKGGGIDSLLPNGFDWIVDENDEIICTPEGVRLWGPISGDSPANAITDESGGSIMLESGETLELES